MTPGAHGDRRKVPWMIIFVVFYVTCFLAVLAAAIIVGGPITSGLCFVPVAAAVHLFCYSMINPKSDEH